VAVGNQLFQMVLVDLSAPALVKRSFIPIDFQPFEGLENCLHRPLGGAGFIRVFNSQNELPLGVTGMEPIK
jgi:hypothetical protein